MPAWPVDGMDVLGVAEAAKRAVLSIRAGGGPIFLEFQTYRFRAHSMFDPELYREKEEVLAWKEKGPVTRLVRRLQQEGLLSKSQLDEIDSEVDRRVGEAIEFAEASEVESPETLGRFVTSERVQS
jgi:pyruvate dehydrogenase E1 component alpha subunit